MDSNEINVDKAFSKQSLIFDELYNSNSLTAYYREIFRHEVDLNIAEKSSILEINCGTGIDALYFAGKGHKILATDLSTGMINELTNKIQDLKLGNNIESKVLSYHELYKLGDTKFDYIVSGFGGLNCTNKLNQVLSQFPSILNDKGKITLAIMPKICPWEILMLFKGKFKTAFRRFRKRTPAHIEGEHFYCYYYNPGYIIETLKKEFKLVSLKGVFITVPPDFIHNFIEKYPKLFLLFSRIDRRICTIFPFTQWCDYYIITLQKK